MGTKTPGAAPQEVRAPEPEPTPTATGGVLASFLRQEDERSARAALTTIREWLALRSVADARAAVDVLLRDVTSRESEEQGVTGDSAALLVRQLAASGLDPAEWIALSPEKRKRAVVVAARAQAKAWSATRGTTPRGMEKRLFSKESACVVNEIDGATRTLLGALDRFHKLGLSLHAVTAWLAFQAEVRWECVAQEKRLPTLAAGLDRWWCALTGLRPLGIKDGANRQRAQDMRDRLHGLRDAVGDDVFLRRWAILALGLLREISKREAAHARDDVKDAFELMCSQLGLNVSVCR